MNKLFFIGLCMMIGAGAFAQNKDQEAVARTIDTLAKAILDGDSTNLDRLTDSNLTYGHSAGRLENKREFVSSLASGQSDFESLNISDQTIVVKNKTAVVRHKMKADIVDKGSRASVNLGVLMIFVKDKKQWRLIARQAVKI
jgi:hypothetical protein